MNTPFKGQISWLPDFIGEELMNQQELQGNKRDISVFERIPSNFKIHGAFDWDKTRQGELFWHRVLTAQDINLFLAWFKPELEVFDDENEKHLAQVIGYNENERYPFFIKKEVGKGFAYKHAQLPKKNDSEKIELLKKIEEFTKQANELLIKAAESKDAAEKFLKLWQIK